MSVVYFWSLGAVLGVCSLLPLTSGCIVGIILTIVNPVPIANCAIGLLILVPFVGWLHVYGNFAGAYYYYANAYSSLDSTASIINNCSDEFT